MKKNMGGVDRIIRTLLAVVFIILYWTKQVTGVVAIILGILAIVFLITSALGFCPLYVPLGISTKRKEKTT